MRRRPIRLIVLGITLMLATSSALSAAGSWPDRDVTMIVPPSAGGGTDLLFRKLSSVAERMLKVPIVVVNRPGAGGAIGHGEIARAKSDGYTLGAVLQQIYLPMTRPEVPYRWTDFTYIMMVNADPMLFTVQSTSPIKTFGDLIEAAKKTPGKITVGNCGLGCISHLAAGMVERKAKVSFRHVPFEGHAPGRTALLGGHLDVMVMTPPEAFDQIQAGKIRALGVCSDKRDPLIPDIPTLKELGYDVVAQGWRSVGGPKGLSSEVIDKVHKTFKQALDDSDVAAFMKKAGFPRLYMTPEELNDYVKKERKEFRATLESLGLLKCAEC